MMPGEVSRRGVLAHVTGALLATLTGCSAGGDAAGDTSTSPEQTTRTSESSATGTSRSSTESASVTRTETCDAIGLPVPENGGEPYPGFPEPATTAAATEWAIAFETVYRENRFAATRQNISYNRVAANGARSNGQDGSYIVGLNGLWKRKVESGPHGDLTFSVWYLITEDSVRRVITRRRIEDETEPPSFESGLTVYCSP